MLESERIKVLSAYIQKSNEPYVVLGSDQFQYDESFLAHSVDKLDSKKELFGVRWCAWLEDSRRGLYSSLFTWEIPGKSYTEAKKALPLLEDPLNLFCFCVLRREALSTILLEALRSPKDKIATYLFSIVTSQNMHFFDRPMIVAHEAQAEAAVKSALTILEPKAASYTPAQPIVTSPMGQEEAVRMIEQAIQELNTNNNGPALSLINRVLESKHEMPALYYARAVAEARLGRVSEAVVSLQTLLQKDAGHAAGKQLLEQLAGHVRTN